MAHPLPNDTRARVVLADDEPLARRRLRALLAPHADFEIIAECANGPETVQVVTALRPDVVLLDIEMPDLSGLALVAELPEPRPKIVFVTAHERYAVDAFGVRALDYILKPFDEDRFNVTLGRIRDEFSTKGAGKATRLRLADLEVDRDARRVWRDGKLVVLRPREFDALVRFMEKPGHVVTRRELLHDIWGYESDVVSRTIDTHVFELRRKLGHASGVPGYIETVSKIGYRMIAGSR